MILPVTLTQCDSDLKIPINLSYNENGPDKVTMQAANCLK